MWIGHTCLRPATLGELHTAFSNPMNLAFPKIGSEVPIHEGFWSVTDDISRMSEFWHKSVVEFNGIDTEDAILQLLRSLLEVANGLTDFLHGVTREFLTSICRAGHNYCVFAHMRIG